MKVFIQSVGLGMYFACALGAAAESDSGLGGSLPAEANTHPTNEPTVRWRATAKALAQKSVDFNHPPRDYTTNRVSGWPVLVEKQLVTEDADLARRALDRLDRKLGEAMAILPESAHARLRKLRLFLMYGEASTLGGRNNGLEYFQRTAPRFHAHLDPRMASSIVIYSATNYVWLSEFWALKALVHELAHAHQLEQVPEYHPDSYDAWMNAKTNGLYRNVTDDKGKTLKQGYAIQNHLEYFAELSCMYFVGCNYAPTNRAAFKEYDPVGFKLVEKWWQDGPPGPARRSAP